MFKPERRAGLVLAQDFSSIGKETEAQNRLVTTHSSSGLHPDFLAYPTIMVPCLACRVELTAQTGKGLLGPSYGRLESGGYLLTPGLGFGPEFGREV